MNRDELVTAVAREFCAKHAHSGHPSTCEMGRRAGRAALAVFERENLVPLTEQLCDWSWPAHTGSWCFRASEPDAIFSSHKCGGTPGHTGLHSCRYCGTVFITRRKPDND